MCARQLDRHPGGGKWSLFESLVRNVIDRVNSAGEAVTTLPNPVQDDANPYVPRNMPAIGDLFDLVQFP